MEKKLKSFYVKNVEPDLHKKVHVQAALAEMPVMQYIRYLLKNHVENIKLIEKGKNGWHLTDVDRCNIIFSDVPIHIKFYLLFIFGIFKK